MELVCPAGSLPALKNAVDNGADAVYFGFRDSTNARQFAGLNLNDKRAAEGIGYAHSQGARVFCAINTYPQPRGWQQWTTAVDRAASLGVDAIILADIGLLDYAANRYPDLPRHLSVQGSATSYGRGIRPVFSLRPASANEAAPISKGMDRSRLRISLPIMPWTTTP